LHEADHGEADEAQTHVNVPVLGALYLLGSSIINLNERLIGLGTILSIVMAGLVPAIHVLLLREDVDARHKAGHDY
jgi:hypothetical protein